MVLMFSMNILSVLIGDFDVHENRSVMKLLPVWLRSMASQRVEMRPRLNRKVNLNKSFPWIFLWGWVGGKAEIKAIV